MKRADKVPAAELRRLERLRELAAAHRKTERALVRAIRSALTRGISVRRVASAIGWPTMNVWRLAPRGAAAPGLDAEDVTLPPKRTDAGQTKADTKPTRAGNGSTKPKASGK